MFLLCKVFFIIYFNLFLNYFIFTTLFLFVLFSFRNLTEVCSKKYMDILSVYVFLFSYIYGLIGKICSLLHYKAYCHGLVHNFLIFF